VIGGGEAALIERYFHDLTAQRDGVELGIGDDAALLRTGAGLMAACCDTLVEDIHFPGDIPPEALGHRVLAVNLSDLAAVGARPAWALLSLTLPEQDAQWLERFSAGFKALADRHGVALVGGDTTHGPLSVSVTALGAVPGDHGLRRGGARPGDGVWVTGTLGDAALGLELWLERDEATPLTGDPAYLAGRLFRPEPRVAAGEALLGRASAAIDVSDGMAGDLSRILRESGVGATLELEALPRSQAFIDERGELRHLLHGGDDYELCFTLPAEREEEMDCLREHAATPVTRIGTVEETPGLRGVDAGGVVCALDPGGYDHFAEGS